MNEEPRACPFCGKPPQGNNWHTYGKNPKDEMRYFCATVGCPNALKKAVTLDEWNTRPIEDGLRAELAASQAEVERLRDGLAWHHCDTHGAIDPVAWGCPECVRELRAVVEKMVAFGEIWGAEGTLSPTEAELFDAAQDALTGGAQ